jgi:hypothetical protein
MEEIVVREHAEQEILHLINRLFLFLDERHYADLAALFAPDGCWHRQGHALRGRDAIVKALSARSATMRICHVITNGMVEPAGEDRAEAQCVMTAYRYDNGAVVNAPPEIAGPAVMARVRARLLHLPEGWRIERMTMDYLFHFAAPAGAAA